MSKKRTIKPVMNRESKGLSLTEVIAKTGMSEPLLLNLISEKLVARKQLQIFDNELKKRKESLLEAKKHADLEEANVELRLMKVQVESKELQVRGIAADKAMYDEAEIVMDIMRSAVSKAFEALKIQNPTNGGEQGFNMYLEKSFDRVLVDLGLKNENESGSGVIAVKTKIFKPGE